MNTIKDLGYHLCKNIPKKNKNKKRIVIITAGPNTEAICQYDLKILKEIFCYLFPVENVPSENIDDTNDAGDAFAGGFLSQ